MALASATFAFAAPWRVIVTRPGREALAWADALQARGVPCETLPLIEIAALPEPLALAQAWQAVPGGAFFHGGPACGLADAQLPRLVDRPGHLSRIAGRRLAGGPDRFAG